jgi:hypothetical protein
VLSNPSPGIVNLPLTVLIDVASVLGKTNRRIISLTSQLVSFQEVFAWYCDIKCSVPDSLYIQESGDISLSVGNWNSSKLVKFLNFLTVEEIKDLSLNESQKTSLNWFSDVLESEYETRNAHKK